jgi:hypothetical protein
MKLILRSILKVRAMSSHIHFVVPDRPAAVAVFAAIADDVGTCFGWLAGLWPSVRCRRR